MKYLFVSFFFISLSSYAQIQLQVDDSGKIYMEKVIKVPSYNKSQLYDITMDWISEMFSSPKDEISFNNRKLGKIKVNYYDDYKVGLSKDTYLNHILIFLKDGRLKIKIFHLVEVRYNYPIEVNLLKRNNTLRSYSGLKDDVEKTLNAIISGFESFIQDYKKEDSW